MDQLGKTSSNYPHGSYMSSYKSSLDASISMERHSCSDLSEERILGPQYLMLWGEAGISANLLPHRRTRRRNNISKRRNVTWLPCCSYSVGQYCFILCHLTAILSFSVRSSHLISLHTPHCTCSNFQDSFKMKTADSIKNVGMNFPFCRK